MREINHLRRIFGPVPHTPHLTPVFKRPFPAHSGTPQQIAYLRANTTIRQTGFSPRFCMEKKIYPVPGVPRRTYADRSGPTDPIPHSEFLLTP
jgi:hypothetical protein